MSIIKFLNYPYPFYEDTKQSVKICVGIGIFITAFCYFFKPVGLDQIPVLGQLGYGLVSFLVCSFYIILLPMIWKKQLRTQGWKIYKEILWICTIVTSLAIANYYYSGFFFSPPSNPTETFLFVIFYTGLIALIPAVAIILYKQLFVYKKIISDTQKISSKLALKNLVHQELDKGKSNLKITSDNNNDILELNVDEFYFLSSSGNYVEIFYYRNETPQKKLIRNNISKIEQQLKEFNSIIRCHRSHMINASKINKASGNLQGYQLQFLNFPDTIPVSRSYTKKIKNNILH